MTLAQLAEKSGLSTGYLSLLERGQKIPSPEAAASLARALGDDEALYRSWAAALRAGVPTSDVMELRANMEVTMATPVYEKSGMSASGVPGFLNTPTPEPDVAAVRVLPTHADPVSPDTYNVAPLYLDRRFIGAEPGDRLFAYEMTPEAAALLDDVAAPGDHIVFSTRVTRITPSRVYAVQTGDRVVAARLGLIGERIVIVPSGGERDVEMVEGAWRDVVRGVAVVVIRRLLPTRSPNDRRPRSEPLADLSDLALVGRVIRGGSDAVMEMQRRYQGTIERAIARSSLPAHDQLAVGRAIWQKLLAEDWKALRQWNGVGSFVPYLAHVLRRTFNDHARTMPGVNTGARAASGEDVLDVPPGGLGPLEILRGRERMNAIERVVRLLAPRDQDLIYRRYVFEEPNADIAAALRMSLSGVYVALYRARARFDRLAEGGDAALLRPLIERMSTSS